MKKIFLLLIAFSFSFLSCEDDDKTELNVPNYSIAGKWNFSKVGSVQTINGKQVIVYEDYENTEGCDADHIVFNADYSYITNDYYKINNICNTDSQEGTYEIGSDTYTLYFTQIINNEPVEFESTVTIVKQTYNTMEISYYDNFSGVVVFNLLTKE